MKSDDNDNHEVVRKPKRSPVTIEWVFNRATDSNGEIYFIAQDPGIEFDLKLDQWFVMFFTGKDNLPAKMVLKPRRDLYESP